MATTRRCRCGGSWQRRLRHWVVTQRNYVVIEGKQLSSKYCELKCRRCRGKWRTNRGYVSTLPDWHERRYAKLTEDIVLDLLAQDRIRVDLCSGRIFKQRKLGKVWTDRWIELRQTPDKKNGHLFVDIKHNGGRRWLAVHRLVWMAANGRVIEEGYDVHHCNEDNTDNAATNLKLVCAYLHQTNQIEDF